MKITFEIDTNNVDSINEARAFCDSLLPSVYKNNTTENVTIELNDIRTALIKLSKNKGNDVAKGLLNEFNAEKLSDVKQSDYSLLLNKIREVENVTC